MLLALLIVAGVVFLILLLIVSWYIGTYNTIQVGKQDIKGQFADILNEYQRRADLFMNLMNSVKGYAKFEKSTLKEVTAMRNGSYYGKTPTSNMEAMTKSDSLLAGLKIQIEAYPELKADKHYSKLMDSIEDTENRINEGRGEYNNIVEDYNKYIKTFPTNLIAGKFGGVEEKFFEVQAKSTDNAPVINVEV